MNINSKYYFIGAIIVALMVGGLIGYLVGNSGKEKAYQKGLELGRQEVEEKYQRKIAEIFPSVPEPTERYSLRGTIKEIKDNFLTVKERISPANPFEEPKEILWKVNVSSATEIIKLTPKSPEELEQEEKRYEEELKKGAIPEIPLPSPYKEEKTDLSELKEGMLIEIQTQENIAGKTEFTAAKVTFQPLEIMP